MSELTQVDLEGTMLSEISQTEKDKYKYGITYMWNLKKKKVKLIEIESRSGCRGLGDGENGEPPRGSP